MQQRKRTLLKQIQFLNWLIDKLEHIKEDRYQKVDELND